MSSTTAVEPARPGTETPSMSVWRAVRPMSRCVIAAADFVSVARASFAASAAGSCGRAAAISPSPAASHTAGWSMSVVLAEIARAVGATLLPRAPAGIHAVLDVVHDRHDLMDLAVLDPERLGELPRPRHLRPCGHGAPVRSLERARVARRMIEEAERERDAMLRIDRHEAAVAYARDEVNQPRFELLEAAPLGRVHVRSARIGPLLSGGRRRIRRERAILDPIAIRRERIDALAVVQLDAGEVEVCDVHQIVARHALGRRNDFGPAITDLLEAERRAVAALHERLDFRDAPPAHTETQGE